MSALSRSPDPVVETDEATYTPPQIDDLRRVEASTAEFGWDIAYRQLTQGPLFSTSIESDLDEMSLLFERHSSPIESLGETPKGTMTLIVPSLPDRVILNGRTLHANEIGVFGPGTEVDGLTREAVSAWNVHIPAERFFADQEALGLETGGFRADRAGFRVVKGQIGTSILAVSMRCHEPGPTHLTSREIADELIQGSVALIAGPHPEGERSLSPPRAMRAARDYIHAHLADPIRIPDLCLAAGMGQRTLERHFRSTYDMTPKAYVRACRLNAAHRTLTDPAGCEASVTDIALRFGFRHLGRFAGEYREFFGCTPMEARKSIS